MKAGENKEGKIGNEDKSNKMDSDVGNAAPSKSTNINYFCACIFILSTSLFMSYIVYTNMCISETKYEIYKCLLGIVWAIFCAVASKFYIKFIFSTLNSKFNKPLFSQQRLNSL